MGKFTAGKLKDKDISSIRLQYHTGKASLRQLGKKYGVSHQSIFYVVSGATYVNNSTSAPKLEQSALSKCVEMLLLKSFS